VESEANADSVSFSGRVERSVLRQGG
jgi:hypothetical protein